MTRVNNKPRSACSAGRGNKLLPGQRGGDRYGGSGEDWSTRGPLGGVLRLLIHAVEEPPPQRTGNGTLDVPDSAWAAFTTTGGWQFRAELSQPGPCIIELFKSSGKLDRETERG